MKIDKEKLIKMKLEGSTTSQCAKEFECSEQAIRDAVKKLKASGLLPSEPAADASDYLEEKHLQTDEKPATKTVAEYLAEEEAAETAKRAAEALPVLEEENPKESPAGKYADVVYDPAVDDTLPTLPPPPIDRRTFWEMRRDELRGAICEYAYAGEKIEIEWVEEYNLIGEHL